MKNPAILLWGARILGLVIIGFMAVGVATSEDPAGPQISAGDSYSSGSSDRAQALRWHKLNAKNDKNVYQQQVTNGWVARDLLEVQSKQLDSLGRAVANPTYVLPAESDTRPVQLLMWAVLAICWFGMTTPSAWPAALNRHNDAQSATEPKVIQDADNSTETDALDVTDGTPPAEDVTWDESAGVLTNTKA